MHTHTYTHTHMCLIHTCTVHILWIVQILYHLSHQGSPLHTYVLYAYMSEGCSVVSDSFRPHGWYSSWDSQGKNTRMDSLSLLQGIFPYIYIYIVLYIKKTMATHSSTLAWKIPWTEEPGRLQSMRSHRVGHDWSDLAAAAAAVLYIISV